MYLIVIISRKNTFCVWLGISLNIDSNCAIDYDVAYVQVGAIT